MKAELILKSVDRQDTFALTSERVTVGRGISAHIRLNDQLVSREHCEVVRMGDRFVMRDLGSSNGTLVNGQVVAEKVLEWGDKIQIGETTLIFVFEKPPPEGTTDLQVTAGGDESHSYVLRSTEVDVKSVAQDKVAGEYLSLLYEVGTALVHKESVAEVCNGLLKTVLRGRRFGRAAVVLFDPQSGEVSERFTRVEPEHSKWKINIDGGHLKKIFAGESLFNKGGRVEEKSYNFMLVPIRGKTRAHGALYVDDLIALADLKESELHMLAALGHLVGLIVESILYAQRLRSEKENLHRLIASENDIIGESSAIRKIMDLVRRVAPTESTVLVRGESGTGKELIARAIHLNSARSGGPLVAVNCGAIPRDLVESELFGHEKGAFTGASARRKGKFESAGGGTLFLDEVGELPLEGQVKLLRVLEARRVNRVGGVEEVAVDVRIIAATNRDLTEAVSKGTFRQDLFYRLNVFEISVPPLRDRRDDVLTLAYHFLEDFRHKMGRPVRDFLPESKEILKSYDWPGNVRELRNIIERAVLLSSGEALRPEDFPSLLAIRPGAVGEVPTLDILERDHIIQILRRVGGNKTEAARLLGINRSTLYEKLSKYHLDA